MSNDKSTQRELTYKPVRVPNELCQIRVSVWYVGPGEPNYECILCVTNPTQKELNFAEDTYAEALQYARTRQLYRGRIVRSVNYSEEVSYER